MPQVRPYASPRLHVPQLQVPILMPDHRVGTVASDRERSGRSVLRVVEAPESPQARHGIDGEDPPHGFRERLRSAEVDTAVSRTSGGAERELLAAPANGIRQRLRGPILQGPAK